MAINTTCISLTSTPPSSKYSLVWCGGPFGAQGCPSAPAGQSVVLSNYFEPPPQRRASSPDLTLAAHQTDSVGYPSHVQHSEKVIISAAKYIFA